MLVIWLSAMFNYPIPSTRNTYTLLYFGPMIRASRCCTAAVSCKVVSWGLLPTGRSRSCSSQDSRGVGASGNDVKWLAVHCVAGLGWPAPLCIGCISRSLLTWRNDKRLYTHMWVAVGAFCAPIIISIQIREIQTKRGCDKRYEVKVVTCLIDT